MPLLWLQAVNAAALSTTLAANRTCMVLFRGIGSPSFEFAGLICESRAITSRQNTRRRRGTLHSQLGICVQDCGTDSRKITNNCWGSRLGINSRRAQGAGERAGAGKGLLSVNGLFTIALWAISLTWPYSAEVRSIALRPSSSFLAVRRLRRSKTILWLTRLRSVYIEER